MTDWLPIALYIALVLVPIVPAFLLFKLLPSSGSIEGPLQGLQIKLGGAFAGYFAVVLVSYLLLSPMMKERSTVWERYVTTLQSQVYQNWRVTGRVGVGKGNPELVRVFIRPPDLHVQPDGTFRFDIPMLTKPDGSPDPPILVFDSPDFVTTTLGLMPAPGDVGGVTAVTQHPDIKNRVIRLDPFVLTPKSSMPAYRPPIH